MTQQPDAQRDLNWLLDQLVARVPETRHAVVLSEDGLLLGLSAASHAPMPSTSPPSPPACRASPAAPATASTAAGSDRP